MLKTYWNDNSEQDWEIYFWIGNEASVSANMKVAYALPPTMICVTCDSHTHIVRTYDAHDTHTASV